MAAMRQRVRPPGGFELWWWYFMRLSGLLLVVLAVGHLFIMHLWFNVEMVHYSFVAERWAHPRYGVLWRLWDLSLLSLAVLHGFNGVRQVLYEYIHRPFQRVVMTTAIWSGAVVLIVLGTYAIIQFEENKAYTRRFREANPGAASPGALPETLFTPAVSPSSSSAAAAPSAAGPLRLPQGSS